MSNTTRLLAIIAALVLTVFVAVFGINTLRRSHAQAGLESAMKEIATAKTDEEYQKAIDKVEKAVKQGAVADDLVPQVWRRSNYKPQSF